MGQIQPGMTEAGRHRACACRLPKIDSPRSRGQNPGMQLLSLGIMLPEDL